jgi:CRP-like cAMP-binding protein
MALSREERRAFLERVPLFTGCPPESLARVAEAVGELEFRDGQLIVQRGQVGNGLYIIVSGTAVVMVGSEQLARIGPGDFFGELAVLDQQPRVASVLAEGPTACLALASWDLLSLLEQDSQLALNMLRELARRIRGSDEQPRH